MSADMGKPAFLLICETCHGPGVPTPGPDDRAGLRDAIGNSDLNGRIAVKAVQCLGGCADPVSIGLQGAGLASYVFSGVDLDTDRADILATCGLYLDSPDGWIEDARPCGRLRNCLRARIPAIKE